MAGLVGVTTRFSRAAGVRQTCAGRELVLPHSYAAGWVRSITEY